MIWTRGECGNGKARKAIESTRKVGGRFALADYFAPIWLAVEDSDSFKI